MKPTVSLTSTRGTPSGTSARTVVSSVAKSLLATSTSLPVQRAHQGGFARVRVADQRDAREAAAFLAPRTLRLAFEIERDYLPLQLRDAVADFAAVRLAGAFTGPAAADPRCVAVPVARPAWPLRAGGAPGSASARFRLARAQRWSARGGGRFRVSPWCGPSPCSRSRFRGCAPATVKSRGRPIRNQPGV